MTSSLRIIATPSSDTPLQCFPLLSLQFDQARYLFNCPEGTVRLLGQHGVGWSKQRAVFVASTASAACGGLGGLLLSLGEGNNKELALRGPLGLSHHIATMRSYVRRPELSISIGEVDPRPKATSSRMRSPPRSPKSTPDKGKARAIDGEQGASGNDAAQAIYSDNYIDVFALPLTPDGYVLPPVTANVTNQLRRDRNARNRASALSSSSEANGKRARTASPASDLDSQISVFESLSSTTNFSPAQDLSPGSPHASEYVSGMLALLFKQVRTPQGTFARKDVQELHKYIFQMLCGAPLSPTMVPLPYEDGSGSYAPQPVPPLVISYVLRGKSHRGVFDPHTASIEHGVRPGYLFSILAGGKSVNIQRPKAWASWPESKRNAWHMSKPNKPSRKGKQNGAGTAEQFDFAGTEQDEVTVHPDQVLGPTRPGPIVIVLHVPAPAYIDSLTSRDNLERLRPYFASSGGSKTAAEPAIVIVHTAPRQVLLDHRYIDFVARFESSSHRMVVGDSAQPSRNITHIITSSAYAADTLAYPSSTLLQLRCSYIDKNTFQVPDYKLNGELDLGTLFQRKLGSASWPTAWQSRTHVAYPDMEISLYPHRQQPFRSISGAPHWDFYIGTQEHLQTESDRKAATHIAAFKTATKPSQPSAGQSTASQAKSKNSKKAVRVNLSTALIGQSFHELDQQRREQVTVVKQAAWHRYLDLANTIQSSIRLEEASSKEHRNASTPQQRLADEGRGVVVTTVGTGSSIPSKYRNVSATLVQLPRSPTDSLSEPAPCVLLDAGDGTYGQLLRKFGKAGVDEILLGLRLIFISHLHADHHMGLVRLLVERRKLSHRATRPVFLVASHMIYRHLNEHSDHEPLGVEALSTSWHERLKQSNKTGIKLTRSPDQHFDLDIRDEDIRTSNLVYWIPTESVQEYGSASSIQEADREWLKSRIQFKPGVYSATPPRAAETRELIQKSKLAPVVAELEAAVPPSHYIDPEDLGALFYDDYPERRCWARLYRSLVESLHLLSVESVRVDHTGGRCYGLVMRRRPIDQTQEQRPALTPEGASTPRAGFSMAYSGDTRPCQALVSASKGVTLLIHEATIQDGREEMADVKGHSTFAQAIDVGRRSGAAATLLTHFSQRYPKLPRLTRKWTGDTAIGGNVRFDQSAVDGGDTAQLDDDAILNAMATAEQSSVIKLDGDQSSPSKDDASADPAASHANDMIIATAFDLATFSVPDLWKQQRYVPALELLFDADEEESIEDELLALDPDANKAAEELHVD